MNTVKLKGDGYLVDGSLLVPNIPGNRHYQLVQEWIAAGNTPEPEFNASEITANAVAESNAVEVATLTRLDMESIRDIREYIAAQPDAPQPLKDREALAIASRGRLA
tara:strand:- start:15933 stop:16253 length:321 start_codon:yes stop_codon:yes gene_type:complete